jgi:hypothetical protein
LDVHRLSDDAHAQFDNNHAGFLALQRWLRNDDIIRIVYEPTGPYHRAFEVAMATRLSTSQVDLSRNCAAPLIAYYAQKQNDYGNETNSRVSAGSGAGCADKWAHTKAGSI